MKKSVYGFDDLLWSNFVPSSAVVYRRAAIPSLAPYADIVMLDWVLHLFAARNGGMGYVDRVMAVYRVHAGGVWSRLSPLQPPRPFGSSQMLSGFISRWTIPCRCASASANPI